MAQEVYDLQTAGGQGNSGEKKHTYFSCLKHLLSGTDEKETEQGDLLSDQAQPLLVLVITYFAKREQLRDIHWRLVSCYLPISKA